MINPLVFLMLLFACHLAIADELATTDSGKRVILKDDGTWSVVAEAEKTSPAEVMSVSDLILDSDQLRGKQVAVQAVIQCMGETCLASEGIMSTSSVRDWIEYQALPRNTRKTLIKCADFGSTCRGTIKGRVVDSMMGTTLHATSIEFE